MSSDISGDPKKTLSFHDLVVEGKDIQYDVFKTQFEALKAEKFEAFNHGYYFPVVNQWILNSYRMMLVESTIQDNFMQAMYEAKKSPINFCRLLELMIKSRFSKTVLDNFDPALNGIELYCELYNAYSVEKFEVLDRIMLLKKFLKMVLDSGYNGKNFNDYVTIFQYYFSYATQLIPYLTLFNVSAEKIDNIISRKNLFNIYDFEREKHRNLITHIKKFDAIKSYDSEEVNYIKNNKKNYKENNNGHKLVENSNDNSEFKKKIKCWICRKFGHSGPECPKYDATKDRRNFDKVQYIELPLDTMVYYTEINNGKNTTDMDAEEIFYISETKFILDSGSSCHLVTDSSLLTNVKPSATTVKGIDNQPTKVMEGDLKINNLILHNVKVFPKSDRNIISGDLLTKQGYHINLTKEHATISKDNNIILKADKKDRFWEITPEDFKEETVFNIEKDINLLQLHKNNGHASAKSLKAQFPELNLKELQDQIKTCLICAAQVNLNHGTIKDMKPTIPGSTVSVDIFGPNNAKYGLILTDKNTGFMMGYILNNKSEASDKVIVLLKRMNNLLHMNGHTIVHLRCDNEFNTNKIINYCEDQGIILELTAPYSSHQNGNSEKSNQIIQKKIKIMLLESGVSAEYWTYAFYYAIYLNNSITRPNKNKSPYELIRDLKIEHKDFPRFGSLCFTYNYQRFPNKVLQQNFNGIFLGFEKSSKIAKVLLNNGTIKTTSSFKTINDNFPLANNHFNVSNINTKQFFNDTSLDNNFSFANNTFSGNNTNNFNVLSDLDDNNDQDTEMKDASNNSSSNSISSNNSIMSNSPEPEEYIPNDYITDASINALHFNNTVTNSKTPTTTFAPLKKPMIFDNENNSSIDSAGDTIMKDFVTSTPKKRLIPVSNYQKHIDNLDDEKHDYVVEEVIEDDDPLNVLERQIIRKPKNLHVAKNKSNEQSTSLTKLDQSLSEYFDAEKEDDDEILLLMPTTTEIIPKTYEDAIKSKNKDKWINAMKNELDSLRNNKVFEETTEYIPKSSIVDSRWVFALKNVDSKPLYKARLVAKGYSQSKGINYYNTYAPVSSHDSLRTLLAQHTLNTDDVMVQFDVKTAFLSSNLNESIYLQPPPGVKSESNCKWKLNKSLYGLKQSPMNFYNKISDVLKAIGFKNSIIEPCVFQSETVKLIIYVDDGILFGSKPDVDKVLKELQKAFTLKIDYNPKVFLGITINTQKGGIKLTLKDYLSKVEKEQNITPNFYNSTPLPENYDINVNSELLNKEEINKYQQIIGILNYSVSTVRFDIAYATSILARKLQSPTYSNMKAAKRVLNYIIATKSFGITYKKNNRLDIGIVNSLFMKEKKPMIMELPKNNEVKVITDASWADQKDRTSTFGYMTFVNNNLVSWKSKKIPNITLSTCESEIVGIVEGTKNALFIDHFMKELRFEMETIKVINDNMAAISSSDHYCNRSKHLEIKWFYTRELVTRKLIELYYIQTNENLSDHLTKNLNKNQFKKLTETIIN